MKRFFLVPILIFLSFVLILYLALPQFQKYSALRDRVKEAEELLAKKKAHIVKVQETADELKKYEEPLEKIESALPKSVDLPSLFNYIQETATATGLILDGIAPAKAPNVKSQQTAKDAEPSRIKETYLSVSLIGQMSSLENFLRALELSSRVFEVETITVEEPGKDLPEISLLIKSYSY